MIQSKSDFQRCESAWAGICKFLLIAFRSRRTAKGEGEITFKGISKHHKITDEIMRKNIKTLDRVRTLFSNIAWLFLFIEK